MKRIYSIACFIIFHSGLFAQLAGSYTIGGTNPSYPDLSSAITDVQIKGITAPVTFNIRPGTYTSSVVIKNIPGTSVSNTLTIQSESGDSSTVIISPVSGYVFSVKQAAYITIRKLGFANYANTSAIILNSASNSIISNNYFNGQGSSIGAVTDEGNSKDISIRDNYIYSGGKGLNLAEQSSSFLIENNTFINQNTYGIYIIRLKQVKIDHNTFNTATAIDIEESDSIQINKNNIHAMYGGIQLGLAHYCSLLNNMIFVENPSFFRLSGIDIRNNSRWVDVIQNSVAVKGGTSGDCALYLGGASFMDSTLVILNNIFVADCPSGYACIQLNDATPLRMDYNVLKNAGSKLAKINDDLYTYYSLSAYQQASKQNLHSLEYLPLFVSASDLHLKAGNCETNQAGTYVPQAVQDIDGDPRNNTAPDIGADEYQSTAYYIGSDTASQRNGNVGKGVTNFPVLKLSLTMDGCERDLIIKKMDFATTGTSVTTDLKKARLFYTGSSGQFDTSLVFGNAILSPNGNFSITGTQTLKKGVNYFWLAYDISASAITGDIIDATILDYFTDTVKHLPSITSPPGNYVVSGCLPNTASIINSSACGYNTLLANPQNGVLYKWTSGETVPAIKVTTSGSYSVNMVDSMGCFQSASVHTVVRQPITVKASASAVNSCPGKAVSLTATALPDIAYHWFASGGTPADTTLYTNTYMVRPLTNTLYHLVARDTISGCSAVDSIMITVVPLDATLDFSAKEMCEGDSLLLAAKSGYTYLWSTGETSMEIKVKNAGKYWARITNSLGCSKTSDTVTVTTIPIPQITLMDKVINGFTVRFKTTAVNAKTYQWDFGDGFTDTTRLPLHIYENAGTYTVTLTAINGICPVTQKLVVKVETDIQRICINQPQNAQGKAITVDASGNFYVVGQSMQSVPIAHIAKFLPNMDTAWVHTYTSGVQNDWASGVDLDASGNVYVGLVSDFYIPTLLKYSPTGSLLWKKTFPNANPDFIKMFVKVDHDNNIYFLLSNFDANAQKFLLRIEKYTASGSLLWSKNFIPSGTAFNAIPNATALDASNSLYILATGHPHADGDLFLMKYDSDGNLVWSTTYGVSTGSDEGGVDIAIDKNQQVYFTGNTSLNGQANFVIGKCSSGGAIEWVKVYNGKQNNADYAAAICVNDNNLFVAGNTYGQFMFSGYIALKYDLNGNLIWKSEYDSNAGMANDAVLDNAGNFYVAGGFMYSNTVHYLIVKFDPSGDIVWNNRYMPKIYGGVITAMAIDSDSKNLYVTGSKFQDDCYTLKYTLNGIITNNEPIGEQANELTVYPNPFSSSATIEVKSPVSGNYVLTVFNMMGEEIKSLQDAAGKFELKKEELSEGVYFFVIRNGNRIAGRGKICAIGK